MRAAQEPHRPNFSIKQSPIWILLLASVFLYLFSTLQAIHKATEVIPYSQFLADIDQRKISEVVLSHDAISGEFKKAQPGHSKYFTTNRIEDPSLVQKLISAKTRFSGTKESGGNWGSFFYWIITFWLLASVWSYFSRTRGGARGPGFLSFGKSKAKIYVETGLKTRFDDVAGVDEAKGELREVVNFLKEPKRYSVLGGRMPKGILLVGPPGTGKTLLARATAGEAGVPFFSINGSEFVEMFVGLGAARVRDLFEQARSRAPCIVFIDELDALGKARAINAITGSSNDEKEQTLNQLLAEMDGFDVTTGVILLAATNRPEILDPALLRAGRFDRNILVDKPDRNGRAQILKVHLKQIKQAATLNLDELAGITVGFSGADLANLVNEAALIATRRGAQFVESEDFTLAVERIVAGLERKNRLLSPKEKKRVSYHEMGHAIVALALGHGEIIRKVSIIPRGISALGYTLSQPIEDRYLMEKNELESKIAIALGGRASEIVFFSDVSTGAGDDLDRATEIARAMVTRYGMSPRLGLSVFERESAPMLGSQAPFKAFDFSERSAQLIDSEIKDLLDQQLKRAKDVIEENRYLLEEAAQILLKNETLDGAHLKKLWEERKNASVA